MSNHTPGPWRFDPKLGVVSQFEINDVGEPMNIAQEVNYLDGSLLAAAPEMLEALELADAMLCGANMDKSAIGRKINAALAKAKGKADGE